MSIITVPILGYAAIAIGRMNLQQKSDLADEIFAQQPQLLASVLVQHRYGTSFVQLDVLINMLLIFFQAMKDSGRAWPVISEDMQERCLKRVVGRVMFIEGLTSEQASQALADFTGNHPEPQLIAFAFGELTRMGILGIKNEAEKYFVLAAVNLVECICEAAKYLAPANGGD